MLRSSFLAHHTLDGNLHPCFHDQSRSLTDHPCNGTYVAPRLGSETYISDYASDIRTRSSVDNWLSPALHQAPGLGTHPSAFTDARPTCFGCCEWRRGLPYISGSHANGCLAYPRVGVLPNGPMRGQFIVPSTRRVGSKKWQTDALCL